MKKFYYLRQYSNGLIKCCLSLDKDSRDDFLHKLEDYRNWNKQRRYIEIPISCVKKVYGIKNIPTTNDGIVWPRPWPQ